MWQWKRKTTKLVKREIGIYFLGFYIYWAFRLKTNTGKGESKREETNVEHVKKLGNWDYRYLLIKEELVISMRTEKTDEGE